MQSGSFRILVLYAHSGLPPSRVNARLADAARAVPHVYLHDLYQHYPDFYIDVKQEQRLVEQADMVVFQHPVQWYGMPSLMKEWLDAVLEEGWAFGDGATALHNKQWWSVLTTGGNHDAYGLQGKHGFPFETFLPPFIQTARLCGMRWMEPLVLHGAHLVDEYAVAQHVEAYRAQLERYPD